jgi:hypothetical protein
VQAIRAGTNLLDDSWRLELPARLGDGELSGRDFTFAYGPLFQLLHGAGWLVPPHDIASVVRFAGLGEAAVAVAGLWILLSLTRAPPAWRAAALLVWAAFLPCEIKPLAGLAVVSTLASRLGTEPGDARARSWALLGWAASAPLLTLYSFDLGIVTLAALLIAATGVTVAAWLRRDALRRTIVRRALLAGVATVGGAAVFTGLLAALPGWVHYLPDTVELSRGYAEKHAFPLTNSATLQLLGAAGAAMVVAGWADSRLRAGPTEEGGRPRHFALLAAALFALLWTRYGLSRSDSLHVFIACAPTVLTAGVLLPCHLRAEGKRRAGPLLGAGLAAAAALGLSAPVESVPATGDSPPALLTDRGRLRIENVPLQRGLERVKPDGPRALLVWPYETMVNVIARKSNPVATLQLCSANTDRLEQRTVANLLARPGTPVLLFTRSWPMDDVEHLSRSPLVFRHLLDHYELDGAPAGGIALLRPASTGAPRWAEEKLAVAPASYAPGGDRFAQIALPDDCCRANDFLIVRLRAARTPTFGLFKPGRFFAGFRFDRGAPRRQPLALPQDGEAHTVLLSAVTVREPLFLSAFAPQGVRARERLLGIAFKWLPMDFLSLAPAELTVESVSVLRRRGEEEGPSGTTR